MKLYYAPSACSLSPHIALKEAGLAHTLVKVDMKSKTLDGGGDFNVVNGKGYVPTLELDDGTFLTEGPAIVQYIADRAPAANLAPANGTMPRYRLQEWLNFISTELHKQYSPLFDEKTPVEVKAAQRVKLGKRFDWIVTQLGSKPYLMDTFSVADGYLFTVLSWSKWVDIELSNWPMLAQYVARVGARPHVVEALKAEGLVKG